MKEFLQDLSKLLIAIVILFVLDDRIIPESFVGIAIRASLLYFIVRLIVFLFDQI